MNTEQHKDRISDAVKCLGDIDDQHLGFILIPLKAKETSTLGIKAGIR